MTMDGVALPAEGSTEWYAHYSAIDTTVRASEAAEPNEVLSRYYSGGTWEARGTASISITVLWISYTSGVIDPPDFVEDVDLLFVPA